MEPVKKFVPLHKKLFSEGLERVNAFSDGIFAIAVTLLVLDIHSPVLGSGDLGKLPDRLFDLWPKILSYVISFLVISSYWVVHHRLFTYIKRYDARLVWLNNFYLLTIAFQPFPTAVLGDYANQTVAVVFYAATQVVTILLREAMWVHASRNHRLVDPDLDPGFIRYFTWSALTSPVIFLVSIGIAFVDPTIAMFFWLLLVVDNRVFRWIYPKFSPLEPEGAVLAAGPAAAETSPTQLAEK